MEMGKSVPVIWMFPIAVATMIILYLVLGGTTDNYLDCYMERGLVADSWIEDKSLYIEYASDNRIKTVWFENDLGEHLNLTEPHIDLRWCYIEELNAYRVRGAWTW